MSLVLRPDSPPVGSADVHSDVMPAVLFCLNPLGGTSQHAKVVIA